MTTKRDSCLEKLYHYQCAKKMGVQLKADCSSESGSVVTESDLGLHDLAHEVTKTGLDLASLLHLVMACQGC